MTAERAAKEMRSSEFFHTRQQDSASPLIPLHHIHTRSFQQAPTAPQISHSPPNFRKLRGLHHIHHSQPHSSRDTPSFSACTTLTLHFLQRVDRHTRSLARPTATSFVSALLCSTHIRGSSANSSIETTRTLYLTTT